MTPGRRSLIHPRVLGFVPPRPKRRLKSAPPLTEQEQRDLDLERAYQCGARYSCNNWRRREPPRFRGLPPGHPGFTANVAFSQAFHRGYDAATRARYAHRRAWDDGLPAAVPRQASHQPRT